MYVLSAEEEDPVLQKLLFSVPADGLSSKNLLLKHNLLWTAAEGSYRKFFFSSFCWPVTGARIEIFDVLPRESITYIVSDTSLKSLNESLSYLFLVLSFG